MPDYHVHTFRCGHAGGDLAGLRRGGDRARPCREIAFTDHIPLYFLPPERRDPKLAMREDEFDGYIEEVRSLAREFRGRITVPSRPRGRLRRRVRGRSSSAGSLARNGTSCSAPVHWVAGDWIDAPGAAGAIRKEGGVLYRRILPTLAKAASDRSLRRPDAPSISQEIRKSCISAGRSRRRGAIASAADAGCTVEISSAGLRKPVGEIYPEERLLRRLIAAGIPVTFSSDAHAPAEVGWDYERTIPHARLAGARAFVTFEEEAESLSPAPGP